MFRSVLSVFLGFVLMMILVMTYQMMMSMFAPEALPTAAQLESGTIPSIPVGINLIMLLCDVLIAVFGGYFTVAIAGKSRVGHAKALAAVIVLMSAMTLPMSLGVEATWYVALRFVGVPVCVSLGGRFRCTQYPPLTNTGQAQ